MDFIHDYVETQYPTLGLETVPYAEEREKLMDTLYGLATEFTRLDVRDYVFGFKQGDNMKVAIELMLTAETANRRLCRFQPVQMEEYGKVFWQ